LIDVDDIARDSIRELNCAPTTRKKQVQVCGGQKVPRRKVKKSKPNKDFVLVYSLGDEMYKWARPSQLFKFRVHLESTYSFPPGWGRKVRNHRQHLEEADTGPFNGRKALQEALDLMRRRDNIAREEREHRERQTLYSRFHSIGDMEFPTEFTTESEPESCPPSPPTWTRPPVCSTPPLKRGCTFAGGDSSTAKRPRSSAAVPGYLRGAISVFGEALEGTEASDRFSQDSHKRALAVLGLHGHPSDQEIKKAFRMKALECHPDKLLSQSRAWGESQMKELNWAYGVLTGRQKPSSTSAFMLPALEC